VAEIVGMIASVMIVVGVMAVEVEEIAEIVIVGLGADHEIVNGLSHNSKNLNHLNNLNRKGKKNQSGSGKNSHPHELKQDLNQV